MLFSFDYFLGGEIVSFFMARFSLLGDGGGGKVLPFSHPFSCSCLMRFDASTHTLPPCLCRVVLRSTVGVK